VFQCSIRHPFPQVITQVQCVSHAIRWPALLGHALASLSMLQCGKYLCFCNCLCTVVTNAAAMTVGASLDMKAATTQSQSTLEGAI